MKPQVSIILLIIMITLTGCSKLISTEESSVQVKIVDSYHRNARTMTSRVGFVTSVHHRSARNIIVVEYDSIKYDFNDIDLYNKYSDRVGDHINGTLEIKKYSDGTRKYKIINIE